MSDPGPEQVNLPPLRLFDTQGGSQPAILRDLWIETRGLSVLLPDGGEPLYRATGCAPTGGWGRSRVRVGARAVFTQVQPLNLFELRYSESHCDLDSIEKQ